MNFEPEQFALDLLALELRRPPGNADVTVTGTAESERIEVLLSAADARNYERLLEQSRATFDAPQCLMPDMTDEIDAFLAGPGHIDPTLRRAIVRATVKATQRRVIESPRDFLADVYTAVTDALTDHALPPETRLAMKSLVDPLQAAYEGQLEPKHVTVSQLRSIEEHFDIPPVQFAAVVKRHRLHSPQDGELAVAGDEEAWEELVSEASRPSQHEATNGPQIRD